MKKYKTEPQSLLSTIWLFVLLNIIFRDIHQLGTKSYMEQILSGVVNGMVITDELMLLGGFLVEIPILMVLLPRILAYKANKWSNIIASILTILVTLSAIPYVDMDDVFFMIIELTALVFIIRIAWNWPQPKELEETAIA